MKETGGDTSFLNQTVVRLERDYRDEKGLWNRRLRFIPSEFIRARTSYFPLGFRLTSMEIRLLFFTPVWPFGFDQRSEEDWAKHVVCPGCNVVLRVVQASVDHVKPISRGGLEFDRSNLRFLCLRCNIKRGNRSLVLADGRVEGRMTLEAFA